jgi:hypothetical protein
MRTCRTLLPLPAKLLTTVLMSLLVLSKPLAVLFWLMCAVLALVDGAGKTLRRARSTQVRRLCSLHSFVQPVISGHHVLQPQPLTSQMNCRLFRQAQTPTRMMIQCRSRINTNPMITHPPLSCLASRPKCHYLSICSNCLEGCRRPRPLYRSIGLTSFGVTLLIDFCLHLEQSHTIPKGNGID